MYPVFRTGLLIQYPRQLNGATPMRKILSLSILMMIICFGIFSCETATDSEEDLSQMVQISGQVVNATTGAPLENVVVIVLEYTPEQAALTNADGQFNFQIEIEQTLAMNLVAFRENFNPDTISVLAVPGRIIDDLQFELLGGSAPVLPTGEAASIILAKVSPSTIGVRESGSPEVAEVVFEVQDSLGVPVDIKHKVLVNFYIGSSPGGGAFLYPLSGETDHLGQVKTTLFSGDSAGVVQLVAVVNQSGRVLQSKPVTVAIHGGLPDATHFSLAVNLLNFPGYNIYGLTNGITAYVGDKYGNPVKPETPVYFTTTGGIIAGSAFTDLMGRASVDLMSAAPKPNHPTLGAGFATVTGRTADENRNTIEAYAIVLFSGLPQISVSPNSIDVPDQGSQSFSFTVSDQNGNPLAGGTNIRVVVETGSVEAVGNTNIILPDTQSPFWTNFGFTLVDTTPDTSLVNPVNVKISTSGPNGNLETNISGIAR